MSPVIRKGKWILLGRGTAGRHEAREGSGEVVCQLSSPKLESTGTVLPVPVAGPSAGLALGHIQQQPHLPPPPNSPHRTSIRGRAPSCLHRGLPASMNTIIRIATHAPPPLGSARRHPLLRQHVRTHGSSRFGLSSLRLLLVLRSGLLPMSVARRENGHPLRIRRLAIVFRASMSRWITRIVSATSRRPCLGHACLWMPRP